MLRQVKVGDMVQFDAEKGNRGHHGHQVAEGGGNREFPKPSIEKWCATYGAPLSLGFEEGDCRPLHLLLLLLFAHVMRLGLGATTIMVAAGSGAGLGIGI